MQTDLDAEMLRLKELYESQAWARTWQHNIVPSGKPAQELACAAIRALPRLFAALARSPRPAVSSDREAIEPVRYHFTDAASFDVQTAEGLVKLGAGWLAITEQEYAILALQKPAPPVDGMVKP